MTGPRGTEEIVAHLSDLVDEMDAYSHGILRGSHAALATITDIEDLVRRLRRHYEGGGDQ